MAYATSDDVLARAGRIGGYFAVDGNRPNLNDIDDFCDQASADVDEAIRSRGFDPTALDDTAQRSLQDLVAYGALARAVRGIGDASPQVQAVLKEADDVWKAALGDPSSRQADAIKGSIRLGDHPVIRALLAGEAGGEDGSGSAGDLWGDEPDYGRPESLQSEFNQLWGTNLAPGVSRGQHL